MKPRWGVRALAMAILLQPVAPTYAVTVRSWSASTAEQLAAGTLDGTAIDGEGRVRLAPELRTLWGPGDGIVWGVQPYGDDAAWVALSGPGRLLEVDGAGEPRAWFEAEGESLVTSLVADGQGGVYFGLSPEGRVMHADSPDAVEPVVQSGSTFIWALALDERGTLWIGTGIPGLLMRRSASGAVETVFHGEDDPVRCLAALPGGGVVFGTGGQGRVIRHEHSGRPFVLLDADESEIVAVAAMPDGTVYALATRGAKQVSGAPGAEGPRRAASQTVRVVARPPDDEPTSEEAKPEPEAKAPTRDQRLTSTPGGALYRIDPDGASRVIWKTDSEMPFALVARDADRVYVATGDSGMIHVIDREGRASRLLRVASNQASAMALAPGGRVLIGGSTNARVEALGPGPRPSGEFLSPAVDAEVFADWGRLRWNATIPRGTKLTVQARSGNSAVADDTWSDWVEVRGADGVGGVDSAVPPARWFQARFTLSAKADESPSLSRMEIFYLSRNRAPEVTRLEVQPVGVVMVRGPAASSSRLGPIAADDPAARRAARSRNGNAVPASPMRRSYEAGARTFRWQALDPDGDRLTYSLELKREGEGFWFPLATGLEDDFLSWDARGMPSGLYRVRLTVDDSTDNPEGSDLQARQISETFTIDNTRPSVGEPKVRAVGGGHEVEFVALDPGGGVAAVEISLEGTEWQPLNPLDGVADSEKERYRVVVGADGDAAGERALMVRVSDASGNLGGDLWVLPGRGE